MSPIAVVAVVVLGAVMFGSRGSGTGARRSRRGDTPEPSPPSGPPHTTETYARSKLAMLRGRADNHVIRRAAQRWGAQYLPGVPPEAVIALGASSTGPNEQLNRPPGAWGLLGVEPSWIDSHGSDETTLRELGRAVTRSTYPRDLAGQMYLGCRRYAQALSDARSVGAEVDATAWGPWEYQCAVCCYSAGQAHLRTLLQRASVAARHDPRGQRWTRVAEDTNERIVSERERMLAFALVRPRERYASALALARNVVAPLSWYSDVETWPTEIDVALVELSQERPAP